MDESMRQVRAVLSTTPARWASLTETIPAELLERVPLPGEWSALDCLRHMVDVEEQVFPARVRRILQGREFDPYDRDALGSRVGRDEPIVLASRLAAGRHASLALVDGLTPADLPKRARHPSLGVVTMEELLHEWAGHDLQHTVQAERAMLQPFIAGSGPWRSYFAGLEAEIEPQG